MIIELFFSLLLLSGLAAILALILEIADAYLADYGEKHILVNNEKDLLVKGGKPLLQTLSGEGIFIPSACGGKGTCAYCKVRIKEGGGPVLPTERPYLTPEELADGSRLSCQVKVKEDLAIQIPEELFLVKEYRVEVERLEMLTPEIKGMTFKILEPEEGITFHAGQYVQLEVPKYKGTRSPEYRAYSICSDPEIHDRLELAITKEPGGVVSTYVHDYLKVGDELSMSGPYGEFYLRPSDRNILLIATGSEVAVALEARYLLAEQDVAVRVVSMPSWDIFERQDEEYKNQVLPPEVEARVSVEAGVTMGWERYVGFRGTSVGINRFGASAPGETVLEKLGITPENVTNKTLELLGKSERVEETPGTPAVQPTPPEEGHS